MPWATYLVLSSAVSQVQLSLLYQKERFQFVDIGRTAQISCTVTEDIDGRGLEFLWYRRREKELTCLIESCLDNDTDGKFVCKVGSQHLTLEISNVRVEDSGLYMCAERYWDFYSLSFSNGSFLVVGDSYTPSTWVMLLQPPKQDPPAQFENQLACVVHGASSLVQVSWDIPGDLRHEARTLLVKNSSGSLTFISLLHVPMDSHISGENVTCEVRFNSSGPSVKKSAVFNATSSRDVANDCTTYRVSVAAVGILALVLIVLSFLWVCLNQCNLEFQRKISKPPSSEVSQDDTGYAQLNLLSKSGDGNKRN
ncbi:uncharacterized protein LOC133374818 [Rhineura floridana]|uniref:uncharacterized protein LOC133374818 n=1 Tax=Rhineura floridana TaxID=261503 RepID=UPI002AC7FCEE|nr:uncharacterized protein LOC133374818 [Rhineura floridana]